MNTFSLNIDLDNYDSTDQALSFIMLGERFDSLCM